MSEVHISEWNRSLILEAIESLERAVDRTTRRGLVAGGPRPENPRNLHHCQRSGSPRPNCPEIATGRTTPGADFKPAEGGAPESGSGPTNYKICWSSFRAVEGMTLGKSGESVWDAPYFTNITFASKVSIHRTKTL